MRRSAGITDDGRDAADNDCEGLLVLLMMVSVLVVIMIEKVCWYY